MLPYVDVRRVLLLVHPVASVCARATAHKIHGNEFHFLSMQFDTRRLVVSNGSRGDAYRFESQVGGGENITSMEGDDR